MEIKSDFNLMQMIGSQETAEAGKSIDSGFDSIFNSKKADLQINNTQIETKQVVYESVEIDVSLKNCLQCETEPLNEVLPTLLVPAESAQKMMTIASTISLLEQEIALNEVGVAPELAFRNMIDVEDLEAIDPSVPGLPELIGSEPIEPEAVDVDLSTEDLVDPEIEDLALAIVAIDPTVVPKGQPKVIQNSQNTEISKVKNSNETTLKEVELLKQSLVHLLKKIMKKEGAEKGINEVDVKNNNCQAGQPKNIAVEFVFTDSTVKIVSENSENFLTVSKKTFSLEVDFIKSPEVVPALKEAVGSNIIEEGSLEIVSEGTSDLKSSLEKFVSGLKVVDSEPVAETSNQPKAESVKNQVFEKDAEVKQGSKVVDHVIENALQELVNKDKPIEISSSEKPNIQFVKAENVSKNFQVPAEDLTQKQSLVQNLNKIQMPAGEVPTFDLGPNGHIEIDLTYKATKDLNLEPEVKSVTDVQINIESEDFELIKKSNSLKIVPEESLQVDKNITKPVEIETAVKSVNKVETETTLKQIVTKELVILEEKKTITNVEQKVVTKQVQVEKHTQSASIEATPLPAVYDSEKELSQQRKQYKEMISKVNKDSVLEVTSSKNETNDTRIMPAARLKELVGQSVVLPSQSELPEVEIKNEKIELVSFSTKMLEQLEQSDVDNASELNDLVDLPVVESERVLESGVDKKLPINADASRQEILDRINQVAVVQKLIRKVQVNKMLSEGVVQMRIDPPELGHLVLKMVVKNSEVTLQVTTENQQAKEMILNQKHLFVHNLKEIGLDVKNIDVNVNKEGSFDFSKQSGQEAQQQKFRQQQVPEVHRKTKGAGFITEEKPLSTPQNHVDKMHLNMIA